ncbi:hypothetical protein [Streptomyces gobitricini]|uniref:Uncharacterized protein n=1 Tax=Streptomyces gobitricini TaxID=68211 RepID=A0ABP5YWT0_9ACTN
MTAVEPRRTLDRLRSIAWDTDFDVPLRHARSRALLMREYLRRAAQWARAYGAEDAWPFFDIAECVDPSITLDAAISAELEEYIRRHVGTPSIQKVCRGVVHWAAVRATTQVELPDIPDMYEPLLLMFERGGGYAIGQFIDLDGVSIPQGSLGQNLSATPFLTLAPTTLDALDGRGRISYYAKISQGFPRSNPRGIVRRRIIGNGDETHDEAFTRNLRWEPTDYLRLYELGHNEVDHVEITEAEAAAFIESATARILGSL